MNFREAVRTLYDLDRQATIYSLDPLPLRDDSRIKLIRTDDRGKPVELVPASGFYVIEVNIAQDAVRAWGWHRISVDRRCDLVAYHAAFDSWPSRDQPSWVDMLRAERKIREMPSPAPGTCRCRQVRSRQWGRLVPELDSIALLEPTMERLASGGGFVLQRCNVCSQFWQLGSPGRVCILGPELARVPAIEIDAWLHESFIPPSRIETTITSLRKLLDEGDWVPTDRVCEVAGCGRPAIRFVTYCKGHFLGSRNVRLPEGRLYPPYDAMMPSLSEVMPLP